MTTKRCLKCGAGIEENQEFGMIEVWEHDPEIHDDGQQHLMGHVCSDMTECAERNIERAYNPEALLEIISDSENYTQEMRDRARQVRRELWEFSKAKARFDDQDAREH